MTLNASFCAGSTASAEPEPEIVVAGATMPDATESVENGVSGDVRQSVALPRTGRIAARARQGWPAPLVDLRVVEPDTGERAFYFSRELDANA